MTRDHLILAHTFWPTGSTTSGWRLPAAYNGGAFSQRHLIDAARTAERGVFDYFFLGNSYSSDPSRPGGVLRRAFQLDGFAAASFVAAGTARIGVVATINTTFLDPYHVAQVAASIDHLSGGRFGLNIVTGVPSDPSFRNFTLDEHPATAQKYARATEFAEVFSLLQDSWSDNWFLDDRDGARLFDPAAAHRIDYVGEHFRVAGPLNAPRPPQGQIPLVHAGTSPESLEFGGRFADVRFSPFVSLPWNKAYAAEAKGHAAAHGRSADEHLIVVGATFYHGDTVAAARSRYREVEAGVVEEFGPAVVAKTFGIDAAEVRPQRRVIDVLPLASTADGEVDLDVNSAQAVGAAGIALNLREVFDAYGSTEITFLDLFRFLTNKNHFPVVVGDTAKIADWIEEGYRGGAFDGVKVFPPYFRSPLDDFVDHVVPELQRRGIARRRYDTDTLRGHLGLPRPAGVFERSRDVVGV